MDTVRNENLPRTHRLDLASIRAELMALEPRREPYWAAPLARGRSVGFRVIDQRRASWIARYRTSDDRPRQLYKSLGWVTKEFGYDRAVAIAHEWFKSQDAGLHTNEVRTVGDACRAYLAHKRAGKDEPAAHDAQRRFERTVFGRDKGPRRRAIAAHSIATKTLDKLDATQLRAWRDGLPESLSLSSKNRTLTALKAALNFAVLNNRGLATKGLEWAAVTPHEIKEDTRRKLFLNAPKRRALLKAAKGGVRNLIEAAMLTGARAGELTHATVAAFNAPERELTLSGKTGTRTIPLSADALALFKKLAKGKKPGDVLLTRDDGKPWAHSDWDTLVKDAAKAAKLPAETCLYTLRHSWISQMIADGKTTLDVSTLAGTSLLMIQEHYGKASENLKQQVFKVKMT